MLVAVISFFPIYISVRQLWKLPSVRAFSSAPLRGAVLSIASVWIIVHAMVDTTGFFGKNHTIPFLSLIVALRIYEASATTLHHAVDDDTPSLQGESKSVVTHERVAPPPSIPVSGKNRL